MILFRFRATLAALFADLIRRGEAFGRVGGPLVGLLSARRGGRGGWFALALVYPLYLNLDHSALWWLLAGGIAYSLGTFFYSAKTRHYSHAIWHLFVIGGCVSHYISISNYVY